MDIYCNFCRGAKGQLLWISYPRPHDRWMDCGKCKGTGIKHSGEEEQT